MTPPLAPLPEGPAALLLEDGRIWLPGWPSARRGSLAIGAGGAAEFVPIENEARFRERRGAATRALALEGRAVTPGLHDAHIHVSEGGLALLEVDCRGARSDEEVAARAALRAAETARGAWVGGRGWDHHLFPGERWPQRAVLDRACPDHPVLLRRVCGHAAWANSAALAAAGIRRDTPDPPGGRIGRDPESGEPDGLLYEEAVEAVRARVPAPDDTARLRGLRAALSRAREHGLTRLDDERGWPRLYAALEEAGELTARVRIWNRLKTPLDELRAWRDSFRDTGPAHARGLVRPGLLKGYLDGSLGARTAWFWEPYADDPSTSGMCTFDPAELAARVISADAAGFQVGLHAIGDRAVSLALDVYRLARSANGPRDARHRVEHAQSVRPRDLAAFAEIGVVASMQPSHQEGDAAFCRARLGPEREPFAYAWRRLLDAGAPLAFGSDFPVESMDPRTSLAPALAGGLTIVEALSAFTSGAAWAAFLEREPFRDLVVWGGDLFEASPEALRRIPVDLTIFEGRIVHERLGALPAARS